MSKSSVSDIVIGGGLLVGIVTIGVTATIVGLNSREDTPSPAEATYVTPAQPWVRSDVERAYLAEIDTVTVETEEDYLALGHLWCGLKRHGMTTTDAVEQMALHASLVGLDTREVRVAAGAATLRMCPEQGPALDAFYGGN